MTSHLTDFLVHTTYAQLTMDLSNLASLTLYAKDEQTCPSRSCCGPGEREKKPRCVRLASDRATGYSTLLPFGNSPNRLSVRLQELGRHAGGEEGSLRAVHLPLRLRSVLTSWVCLGADRVTGLPQGATEVTLALGGFVDVDVHRI
jgi:hypothetical protein